MEVLIIDGDQKNSGPNPKRGRGRPPTNGQRMVMTPIYLTREQRDYLLALPNMGEHIRSLIDKDMHKQ